MGRGTATPLGVVVEGYRNAASTPPSVGKKEADCHLPIASRWGGSVNANQLQVARTSATPVAVQLDELPLGKPARITAVDWAQLVPEEGQRLRALGIDSGAKVTLAYRGVFAGRDPLALEIGRMTIALRRVHARAMTVEPA